MSFRLTRPRRLLAAAAAVATAGTALLVGGASSASADTTIPLSWRLDVTSTVKRINQPITFPQGSFDATLDVDTATITGDADIPAGTTTMKLGSLPLAAVTVQVVPAGQTVAKVVVDGPVWHVTAKQRIALQITSIRPLGLPVNLVPSTTCRTSVFTQTLRGTLDFSKTGPGSPSDYHLKGKYTIPSFSGCGLATPIVNALIPGAGNPIDGHFTN